MRSSVSHTRYIFVTNKNMKTLVASLQPVCCIRQTSSWKIKTHPMLITRQRPCTSFAPVVHWNQLRVTPFADEGALLRSVRTLSKPRMTSSLSVGSSPSGHESKANVFIFSCKTISYETADFRIPKGNTN